MKIHGFVGAREVTVDLPGERIAELGLDPWRLDLLDPNPVTVRVAGTTVSFTRLSDVVFAYTEDSTVFVGVHNGATGVCFYGDSSRCSENVAVTGFKVSAKPFAEHFAKYLNHEKGKWSTKEHKVEAYVLSFGGLFGESKPQRAQEWYKPVPCSKLVVCGDKLVVDNARGLAGRTFCGAMNELRTFNGIALPVELNWVHGALSPWRCTVFGGGLFAALHGKRPDSVDVLIDAVEFDEVREWLRSGGHGDLSFIDKKPLTTYLMKHFGGPPSNLEFTFRGCHYRLFQSMQLENFFDDIYCTVGSLRSSMVNQVVGSRIGFADLGNRQLRYIHDGAGVVMLTSSVKLNTEGFTQAKIERIGHRPVKLAARHEARSAIKRRQP